MSFDRVFELNNEHRHLGIALLRFAAVSIWRNQVVSLDKNILYLQFLCKTSDSTFVLDVHDYVWDRFCCQCSEVNNFLTGPTPQVTNRKANAIVVRSRKCTQLFCFSVDLHVVCCIIEKKHLSTAYSHMFSINFRSETEKNYLIVGRLFFSSDILFSLNNLRFIVSLVWNKFTWIHTQFSFKSAHMLIIAFTWLVNIPLHIFPCYLNTLSTPQICRVCCPNPAKALWGLECYSHCSSVSNMG